MAGEPFTPARIGRVVQQARKVRGWSQTELAVQAGVSRPTVSRIEGGHDVTAAVLAKVASALNLRLDLIPDQ